MVVSQEQLRPPVGGRGGPLACHPGQTQLYLIRVFPNEVSSIVKVHRMPTNPFGGFIFFHQGNRGCPSLGPQTRKTVGASNKAGGFSAVPTGTLGARFTLGAAHPTPVLAFSSLTSPPAASPPLPSLLIQAEGCPQGVLISLKALNFTGPKNL